MASHTCAQTWDAIPSAENPCVAAATSVGTPSSVPRGTSTWVAGGGQEQAQLLQIQAQVLAFGSVVQRLVNRLPADVLASADSPGFTQASPPPRGQTSG